MKRRLAGAVVLVGLAANGAYLLLHLIAQVINRDGWPKIRETLLWLLLPHVVCLAGWPAAVLLPVLLQLLLQPPQLLQPLLLLLLVVCRLLC